MKFILFGLGNIGIEYENTRHNIGFTILNALAYENNAIWEKDKFCSKTTVKFKGKTLLLIKPDTYMNLSGKAVQYWLQKEKVPTENTITITDDLALPVAKLRLKLKGNHGGHNGLRNIEEILGHQNFPRLRFGIGSNFEKGRQVNFVLAKFEDTELESVQMSIKKSIECIQTFVTAGAGLAMTQTNIK